MNKLQASIYPLHYAWIIVAISTLVVFAALGLARFGYSSLLPPMQASLGMNNTQAGIMATFNLIGYLTLSVIGGALAARYGPRVVITVGLALVGVAMLFTGMANTFLSAVLWRTVTGVGSGASNVPVMALVAAWFAARRRGLGSGIAVSGSSIGLIMIGSLVPQVLSAYGEDGWRISWFIFGITTLILALLGWLILRNDPKEVDQSPYGLEDPQPGPKATGTGLQWGRVYRAPAVWHLGLVYIAFGFSYIIYLTFFIKRLIAEVGYTQEAAGGLFMTMGWFSMLCGLIWGTISDKIGRKNALILVYLIHATSFALFAWNGSINLTLSAILFGLTAWSIPAIMAATCGDVLGPRLAPAALGFITLFFGIGQALGPSVAGAMADSASSLIPAYLLASGVALLGAFGTLFLRPPSTARNN